jgi:hypothetical protein
MTGGYIKVNERRQTTAPGVWAIGEVAASPQFTDISIDDFRLNPPAMRSYLPLTTKKTELVLAGRSKTQMFDSIKAAFDKKRNYRCRNPAPCGRVVRNAATAGEVSRNGFAGW